MLKVIENTGTARDLYREDRPERPALETVVAEIARDASVDAAAYLRDTRVPEGGE